MESSYDFKTLTEVIDFISSPFTKQATKLILSSHSLMRLQDELGVKYSWSGVNKTSEYKGMEIIIVYGIAGDFIAMGCSGGEYA